MNQYIVEVVPAEPILIVSFNFVALGRSIPAAPILDAEGRLTPPKIYRGQRGTAMSSCHLFGQVTPSKPLPEPKEVQPYIAVAGSAATQAWFGNRKLHDRKTN